MKYYKNQELADSYLENIKAYLRGERELPASKLNSRPQGIHQSNLNDHSCIQKGYFSNVVGQKPISDDAALRFMYGRSIERTLAFSGELEPILKDDIWVTPDDMHPEFGLTEIKSTTTSSIEDVNTSQPQWICQLKNECYAYGTNKVNLVIFYLVGTMPSYAVWAIKNLPKDTAYKGVELVAWTYEFADMELEDHWAVILGRRDMLLEAIENKTPVDGDIVLRQLPYNLKKGDKVYWQCKGCDFSVECHLFDELVMGIK